MVTCSVLHNFCEMWNELKPRLANLASRREYPVEFSGHILPIHKDGEATKAKEKILKSALYDQWLFNHIILRVQ